MNANVPWDMCSEKTVGCAEVSHRVQGHLSQEALTLICEGRCPSKLPLVGEGWELGNINSPWTIRELSLPRFPLNCSWKHRQALSRGLHCRSSITSHCALHAHNMPVFLQDVGIQRKRHFPTFKRPNMKRLRQI